MPNHAILRAPARLMLALVLVLPLLAVQAAHASAQSDQPFDDVTGAAAPAVASLADAGAIEPCEDGQFCPLDELTRGEAIAMVVDALELDVPDDVGEPTFPDTADAEHLPAIEAAVDADLLADDGELAPDEPINRSGLTILLVRALGDQVPATSDEPADSAADAAQPSEDDGSTSDEGNWLDEVASLNARLIEAGEERELENCGDALCPDRPLNRQSAAVHIALAQDLVEVDDLAGAHEAHLDEVVAQREAEEQARREAEREAEEQARREAEAERRAEEQRQAEEQARREAEAEREAEQQAEAQQQSQSSQQAQQQEPQQQEAQQQASAPAGNSKWDRLAQCESGGDWSINTGNGYYGGLQFSKSSWDAVGGSGYPHEHSRAEQIKRAEILLDRQGWGAWPACSSKLGYR